MSFDPYGYQEQQPLPPGGALPPGSPPPDVASVGEARDRVKLPALFLMVIGVLNMLIGLSAAGVVVFIALKPADQLHQMLVTYYENLDKQNPGQPMIATVLKELKNNDPQTFKNQAVIQYGLIAGGLLVAALVILFGGIRMFQLRSYGLCILASIVASVPCVSPSCCCFGVGALVGIWSIVVLLSGPVRMAFR